MIFGSTGSTIFVSTVFECPHAQIKQDWDNGYYQWREITDRAYRALAAQPMIYADDEGFMSAEPVEILRNGEGLHVCCKQTQKHYFARLAPRYDWSELKHYPLPTVKMMR